MDLPPLRTYRVWSALVWRLQVDVGEGDKVKVYGKIES